MAIQSVAYFDPPEMRTVGDFEAEHNKRLAAQAERITRFMRGRSAEPPTPARGVARPVYRSDGEWYASVSEAARHNPPARADYICHAIRHRVRRAEFYWCYADDIPADFFADYAAAHPGLACVWPWPKGKHRVELVTIHQQAR
jgi:hypothetical protein